MSEKNRRIRQTAAAPPDGKVNGGAPPNKVYSVELCVHGRSETPIGQDDPINTINTTSDYYAPRRSNAKGRKRRRIPVAVETQLSWCFLCDDVVVDPVSTECGHRFCRKCITSHWEKNVSSQESPCPECEAAKAVTKPAPQQDSTASVVHLKVGFREPRKEPKEPKIGMRWSCSNVTEGAEEGGGNKTLLNNIFTELYITEGRSDEIETQPEENQTETPFKKPSLNDKPIRCHDIFKALPDRPRKYRVVVTKGLAGGGKSFLLQKFTLDWAEGLENQELTLVILFAVRELNIVKDKEYCFLTLIHDFHPLLNKVTPQKLAECRVLFVFDGLEENKLSMDFENAEDVFDVTETTSVSGLMVNLIKGNLLPSALIWITSRPSAVSQIPLKYIDRLLEIQGFTDGKKEEYFKRKFPDEDMYSRVMTYIKSSRSLHLMCHIPVFCWITSTVLKDIFGPNEKGEPPRTITDMYSRFLLIQTRRNKDRPPNARETNPQELMEADKEVLLKLARVAFDQLDKPTIAEE
ncbi:NLR family CARD domain-containing protein 3-like [Scomber scombrus]|nr:NLR family CARD domain-containing protein 3-like [Scomber scombrus]